MAYDIDGVCLAFLHLPLKIAQGEADSDLPDEVPGLCPILRHPGESRDLFSLRRSIVLHLGFMDLGSSPG